MSVQPEAEVVGPQWGLREIAAYLHMSADEAGGRLRACGLAAARVAVDGPRWPAQAVIDARGRLGAAIPEPR